MCIALTAGAIVGLVGAGVSMYSSIAQANANKATAEYNARIRKNQTQAAKNKSNEKQNAILARAAQLQSEQRAKYGAGGVDVNQGTPSLIQRQTYEEGVADAMRVQENTDNLVDAREAGTQLTLLNGKNSARLAILRGVANAARTGMSMKSSYEDAFGDPKPKPEPA